MRFLLAIPPFCFSLLRPRPAAGLMIATGLALVAFSIITIASTAQAEAPANHAGLAVAQESSEGKAIFEEKCAGCHSIGGGKLVGPDLKDVTKRRDPQWIKSFISDPAKMIASDATAKQLLQENNNFTMPTLGLTENQVEALVEFLSNPGAMPAAPAAPAAAGLGDPAAGQRLFTGEMSLTGGGPACIACHTVSGAGGLGGGGLGPDLTHAYQRLGEPGLAAALKTIAFPTMLGPFQNHPLTAKEQADLVAFLKNSDRWQHPVPVFAPGALSTHALLVFAIGLGGAGLLFILLLVIWARLKKRFAPYLPVRKL